MSLLARGLRRRQSGGAIAVADVFSTALYTGNGSTQTITNGIDLSGEWGMVWIKSRSSGGSNSIFDTERGRAYGIATEATSGQLSSSTNEDFKSFDQLGFSISPNWNFNINGNGTTYVSWTFRKSPRFFDVVTYTGDGNSLRSVAHNLGIAPGLVFVKSLSSSGNWVTAHRSSGNGVLRLNSSSVGISNAVDGYINNLSETAFRVTAGYPSGTIVTDVNANGTTYVAYLFAHDIETDGVIQCGTYTGNGSTTGPTVTLGWEPQYLLIKNSSATANWVIYDNARDTSNPRTYKLFPNLANSEDTADEDIDFTSTGFQPKSTDATINTNGNTYVYMAIKKAA